MISTLTEPHGRMANDALADELATLRVQRAELLALLRAEKAGGATVVRIERVAVILGAAL